MFARITLAVALATFLVAGSYAQSESDHGLPVVVPLHKIRMGQWVEKVWGDPEKPGDVFAIRIHNDAGYRIMPHVHPMDEHIVVEEFRSIMFRPGVNFYNGAFAAAGFPDYEDYLNSLPPSCEPKVLIVGLYQVNFNDARRKTLASLYNSWRTPFENLLEGDWRTFYVYLFDRSLTLRNIKDVFTNADASYVGLQAKVDKSGFRNDGSYRWGPLIDNPQKYAEKWAGIDQLVNRVTPYKGGFEYGATIPPEAILDLKLFLSAAKQRHTFVIGYLPVLRKKSVRP